LNSDYEYSQRVADLTDAILAHADLTGAYFCGWTLLVGANLEGANLTGTDLEYANLTRANLKGAHLESSDLCSANLSTATLTGANLTGAVYDEQSQWPAGFDPAKRGATMVR
jgi:uncharacterized protein YjbI with pentapeptide repeats